MYKGFAIQALRQIRASRVISTSTNFITLCVVRMLKIHFLSSLWFYNSEYVYKTIIQSLNTFLLVNYTSIKLQGKGFQVHLKTDLH